MKRTLWLLIGCVLFFSSCRWDVDAWWSDEAGKEESRIFRYDRLVDEFVSLNSFSALQRMNTEFPTPTRLLIEDVLGIGRVEDAHIEQHLRDYFLDSTMQILLQDVHSEYSDLSEEELNALVKKDPRWGRIVCRCEKVTEAEIVAAVHAPVPARTVDAVKRRVRAGMGRCQGGFCATRVMEIISEELGIPMREIRKGAGHSEIAVLAVREAGYDKI